MPQPANKPEPVTTQGSSLPSYKELSAQNAQLLEQPHQMREEMQTLRDEIARLKKQTPKPNIGPSKMDEKQKKNGKKRGQNEHGHFDKRHEAWAFEIPPINQVVYDIGC